jgi:hypothetical protein
MTATIGVASARPRETQAAGEEAVSLATINTCFGALHARAAESAGDMVRVEEPPASELSVRALNVLKLLAAEMTGDDPPRKDWLPPDCFLKEVTFERLSRARNCGPLTAEEIIRWARSRGVRIARPSWAGKSFSEMWRYLEARFAAGEPVQAAIVEALDRSVRRKSTRIPVGAQRMLLKLLESGGEGSRRR